jgi:hypothetical protein
MLAAYVNTWKNVDPVESWSLGNLDKLPDFIASIKALRAQITAEQGQSLLEFELNKLREDIASFQQSLTILDPFSVSVDIAIEAAKLFNQWFRIFYLFKLDEGNTLENTRAQFLLHEALDQLNLRYYSESDTLARFFTTHLDGIALFQAQELNTLLAKIPAYADYRYSKYNPSYCCYQTSKKNIGTRRLRKSRKF